MCPQRRQWHRTRGDRPHEFGYQLIEQRPNGSWTSHIEPRRYHAVQPAHSDSADSDAAANCVTACFDHQLDPTLDVANRYIERRAK